MNFALTRRQFMLPIGVVYMDGNSLGPLPKAVPDRLTECVTDEWGELLIRGWNEAGWMAQPNKLGDRIAPIIGAAPGTVTVGDTLSLRVYQALYAALKLNPERRVVLTDSGNFPSDLYMADGLLKAMGGDYELRVVEPEQVSASITDEVAVLMLTEVDFRTGRLHDMARLTSAAHRNGVVTVWDLAHSAGAIEVQLADAKADFAVGCTYKYLNGGPGAPAFIYVRPDLIELAEPVLQGWLGHASAFDFTTDYKPAAGIDRMRVGTPAILGMAALDAALDVWDGISLSDVRAASIRMSELFIGEVERRCPQVELASPRDPNHRGSQVSFLCDNGYPVMQALIERGVIGDFRAPNGMRFGFTPLYLRDEDVMAAVDILDDILRNRLWDEPRFHQRAHVT